MIIKEKIFDGKELDIIKNHVLEIEDKVKNLGESRYPGAGENALTGRFDIFNFFNSDIGPLLEKRIKPFLQKYNFFMPLSIQCWANTLRKDQGIKLHQHSNGELQSFYCANVFICGEQEIGTHYVKDADPEYDRNLATKKVLKKFKSVPGEIALFDSSLFHYVKPNPNNDVRISIAMDIYQNTIFNNSDRYYIMK